MRSLDRDTRDVRTADCDHCDGTGKVEIDVEPLDDDDVGARDDELFGDLGAA